MSEPSGKTYSYPYPRPGLTVDLVLLSPDRPTRVLLIKRRHDPFAGRWAFPGGFVDENESLEAAARRELLEETGVEAADLEQLRTFGDPGRDPRGWTVSVVFIGRVDPVAVAVRAGDDAAEAAWHPLDALPPLAFDHDGIAAVARQWHARTVS